MNELVGRVWESALTSAADAGAPTEHAMATKEARIHRMNASRNRESLSVIVCTSLDQLEPVLITGGENDVENGQNLQKAAKKRRMECGALDRRV